MRFLRELGAGKSCPSVTDGSLLNKIKHYPTFDGRARPCVERDGPDDELDWPRAAARPGRGRRRAWSRYLIVTSLRQCRTEINGNESGRIWVSLGLTLLKSKAHLPPV
jgi:hypothetical protein